MSTPRPRPPLLVDRRKGSRELQRPLRKRGAPAQLSLLPFADFAFEGLGPHGPVTVGVERKTVSELLSAMRGGGKQASNRVIARQLPGFVSMYEYPYLLVEGSYHAGRWGELWCDGREAGYGYDRYTYSEFEHFLTTLQLQCQCDDPTRVLRVVTTKSVAQTLDWLHAQYSWWQKPWQQHGSLKRLQGAAATTVSFKPPSLRRRLAAQLPGVYWVRSAAIDRELPTAQALGALMARADVKDWIQFDGIGPGIAAKIVKALKARD